jgi:hypothetical protein
LHSDRFRVKPHLLLPVLILVAYRACSWPELAYWTSLLLIQPAISRCPSFLTRTREPQSRCPPFLIMTSEPSFRFHHGTVRQNGRILVLPKKVSFLHILRGKSLFLVLLMLRVPDLQIVWIPDVVKTLEFQKHTTYLQASTHPQFPFLSFSNKHSTMVADMSYSTVSSVLNSWELVRRTPNYEEVVGVQLFIK